jgi:hypothetical protein
MSSNAVMPSSVSPSSLVEFETIVVLNLSSGSSSPSRALWLQNFNMIDRELLVMGVQEIKDIFSTLQTNSHICLTCWSCGQRNMTGNYWRRVYLNIGMVWHVKAGYQCRLSFAVKI